MAYLHEDEDRIRQAGPGVSAPATMAAGPSIARAPRPTSTAGSGDFVNIGRYIEANRDVAQRTAGRLAGEVEEKASRAQADTESARREFEEDVRRGSYTDRKQLAPEEPAYSGPSSMADHRGFAELSGHVNDAAARLRATGTGHGLQALMQDRAAGGGYTQGQSALDAALVGGVGGRRFLELRNRFGDLAGALSRANEESAQLAEAARFGSEEQRREHDAIRARQDARAQQEAEERAAAKRAEAERQQAMRAGSGRGDLQQTTVSINDERQAMMDGLYYEWLAAGAPPYEAWKASRGG